MSRIPIELLILLSESCQGGFPGVSGRDCQASLDSACTDCGMRGATERESFVIESVRYPRTTSSTHHRDSIECVELRLNCS